MRSQNSRAIRFRVELIHNLIPQKTRGSKLCDLHVEVHPDTKEKRQTRCKLVDIQSCGERSADIFFAVSKCIGELESGISTCFLNMIARDRNRIELRHIV